MRAGRPCLGMTPWTSHQQQQPQPPVQLLMSAPSLRLTVRLAAWLAAALGPSSFPAGNAPLCALLCVCDPSKAIAVVASSSADTQLAA